MKINDPTWQNFIGEIVSRFGGARNHNFLLDFLKSASNSYLIEARQAMFVIDLLQLKVPRLFAVEEGADEIAETEDLEVARRFILFLRAFINRHALKQTVLAQMSTILVSIIIYIYKCTTMSWMSCKLIDQYTHCILPKMGRLPSLTSKFLHRYMPC